jgi:hypothetical protein
MSGQYLLVHGKAALRDRAVPDFMIAAPRAARSSIRSREEAPSTLACNWPLNAKGAARTARGIKNFFAPHSVLREFH